MKSQRSKRVKIMKGRVYSHGPRNLNKARREVKSTREVIDNKKLDWKCSEG